MIIDVHTHIFPEFIVKAREHFFKGEAAFELLYGSPESRMVTLDGLLKHMDEERIDCSVIFGFPWVDEELTRRHNDYVLECGARFPERIVPLCCVNPSQEWAAREVERCMAAGAVGAGELAIYGPCDMERVLGIFENIGGIIRENKGIMLVHANEPVGHKYPGKAPQGLDFYYDIVKICQGFPLILAHWGGGLFFFNLLRKEVAEFLKDVYLDTAASPYLYVPQIYNIAIQVVGVKKILFGSDYPLLSFKRYMKEMEKVCLKDEEINRIIGGNARDLLSKLRA